MAAVLEKQAKRWTYEEYYKLDDDQRYEIIDGELLMVPAPDTSHQSWLGELYVLIKLFLRTAKLGRLFFAPVDVALDSENTVQPDLVFIASENLGLIQHRAIFGAPDLVVEFVSPTSIKRDREKKMKLYARFGIKEYWIGDPGKNSFEILTLKKGRYQLLCSAKEKGRLRSGVLAGFEFDLSEIATLT